MNRGGREGGSPFVETLEAAEQGAPWARTQLWVEFAPAVAAFATARGSRDPDDLTSEVFIAVFERLAEFRGDERGFRSFVFSVAYRRLVDEFRRRERWGGGVELTAVNDPRRASGADVDAIRRISDARALALLRSLPADQCDVMILRFISDLSVEQTAEVLGKRAGAIRALQHRAVARLRREMSTTRNAAHPSGDSSE